MFGEMALISQAARLASATAKTAGYQSQCDPGHGEHTP
jgi:hypothetical protein